MFKSQKFYDKVNKIRTNLLLFIDKEIRNSNKYFRNNLPNQLSPNKKQTHEIHLIEQTFSFETKENHINNKNSYVSNEKKSQNFIKMKSETCQFLKVYSQKQFYHQRFLSKSIKKFQSFNPNNLDNINKIDVIFKNKKYKVNKIYQRDKVIYFEEINRKIKDINYYTKYLNKLAKIVKNKKMGKKN